MRFIPPGGESGCCQVHWSDGSRRSGHFRGVLMVREREPGSIIIVGSLNADLTVQIARFPQPGETVPGGDLTVLPGGKGANQAVAAARLGGKVRMIGAVGDDSNGDLLLRSLTRAGVDTSQVEIKTGLAAGTAVILVDGTGENIIVVSPGANGALFPADVTAGMFVGASAVGLCLEIPVETVMRAAVMAKQAGATVLTNLSPYQAVLGELLTPTSCWSTNTRPPSLVDIVLHVRSSHAARPAPPSSTATAHRWTSPPSRSRPSIPPAAVMPSWELCFSSLLPAHRWLLRHATRPASGPSPPRGAGHRRPTQMQQG